MSCIELKKKKQVLCACTLFLLFSQEEAAGKTGSSSRRLKTNGTFYSAMETFAEHIYTLPLLGACRLACASFRMDPCAHLGFTSSSKTDTKLVYLDWLVSLGSLAVYVALLSTIHTHSSSSSAWAVSAKDGQGWLQWMLFLMLVFTHLAQVGLEFWMHMP